MSKTKIEWCDMTWNPVWGCLNDCEYCYARKIAKRFAYNIVKKELDFLNIYGSEDRGDHGDWRYEKLRNFKPIWLESNFQKKFPKKSARIFVNSMSDVSFWKDEWIKVVIDRIKEYPQHIFLFLTKDVDFYKDWDWPKNCWLGYTFTTQHQVDYFFNEGYYPEHNKFFVILEPIQEFVKIYFEVDWLIVGGETGNRKERIRPEKYWIEHLVEDRRWPLFLKDNLKPIWGDDLIQEFPV